MLQSVYSSIIITSSSIYQMRGPPSPSSAISPAFLTIHFSSPSYALMPSQALSMHHRLTTQPCLGVCVCMCVCVCVCVLCGTYQHSAAVSYGTGDSVLAEVQQQKQQLWYLFVRSLSVSLSISLSISSISLYPSLCTVALHLVRLGLRRPSTDSVCTDLRKNRNNHFVLIFQMSTFGEKEGREGRGSQQA